MKTKQSHLRQSCVVCSFIYVSVHSHTRHLLPECSHSLPKVRVVLGDRESDRSGSQRYYILLVDGVGRPVYFQCTNSGNEKDFVGK